MKYNPEIHHRRSIRLKDYDYSQAGLYFVTIVTQNRACLFGDIAGGEMVLNDAGKMVDQIWNEIPKIHNGIVTDAFVIMPNHIHGIITVGADSISARKGKGAEIDSAPTAPTLGAVVQSLKRYTTIEYINRVKRNIFPPFDKRIWQRNYWEHIIRNEQELSRIRQYIENNPSQWEYDKLNGGSGNQVLEPRMEYGETPWMV